MNARFIFVCLLGICVACTIGVAEEKPAGLRFQEAYNRMQAADEAREAGRHEEAMDLYRQALREYARLARSYPDWQAGVTRYRMSYCQEQLQLLMDASVRQAKVAGDPGTSVEDAVVSVAEGDAVKQAGILVSHKHYNDAGKLLMSAIRENPDDLRIRLLLGIVRCGEGKFLNAVYILEPLVEDRPDIPAAHVALATAYVGLGRKTQAIEQLRSALRVDPRQSEAHYNLAQLLMRVSEPDIESAENHYRQSIETGGDRDSNLEAQLSQAKEKAGILSRLKFW